MRVACITIFVCHISSFLRLFSFLSGLERPSLLEHDELILCIPLQQPGLKKKKEKLIGIQELWMDIRDLINLRKEECFLKRAKMTGFMKGQKTK